MLGMNAKNPSRIAPIFGSLIAMMALLSSTRSSWTPYAPASLGRFDPDLLKMDGVKLPDFIRRRG